MSTDNVVRFQGGAKYRIGQGAFLLYTFKYALQPGRYPLFKLGVGGGGLIGFLRSGPMLGLTRRAEFNGGYYTAPMLPRFPSPAFDRMVARGGLNNTEMGTPWKRQTDTVILAVTRRCELHCAHCYERFSTAREEAVTGERWRQVVREIQNVGASVIVLSGGEPMLRYGEVLKILKSGDKRRSDFHLHTSGLGVTAGRARELREAGLSAAAVGLDGATAEVHDSIRGVPGSFRQAVEATGHFRNAGVLPYLNVCLTRQLVRSGGLPAFYEKARELNVAFVQMLEPRPCGGYLRSGDDVLLTEEDRKVVREFYEEAVRSPRYRCHPILYYVGYLESPERMGCTMGGLSHLAIDGRGNVTPCVFLPVTFGNVMVEGFPEVYRRMREAVPRPIRGICPSLALSGVIRQGGKEAMPVPYEWIREEFGKATGMEPHGEEESGTCEAPEYLDIAEQATIKEEL